MLLTSGLRLLGVNLTPSFRGPQNAILCMLDTFAGVLAGPADEFAVDCPLTLLRRTGSTFCTQEPRMRQGLQSLLQDVELAGCFLFDVELSFCVEFGVEPVRYCQRLVKCYERNSFIQLPATSSVLKRCWGGARKNRESFLDLGSRLNRSRSLLQRRCTGGASLHASRRLLPLGSAPVLLLAPLDVPAV